MAENKRKGAGRNRSTTSNLRRRADRTELLKKLIRSYRSGGKKGGDAYLELLRERNKSDFSIPIIKARKVSENEITRIEVRRARKIHRRG